MERFSGCNIPYWGEERGWLHKLKEMKEKREKEEYESAGELSEISYDLRKHEKNEK